MSGSCLFLNDGSMFMHILFTFGLRHHLLGVEQTSRFGGSKFCWILWYNTSFKGFH